jgi:hypothetical protein
MPDHSYALNSSVPVERSKAQIRGYLAQMGADGFADAEQRGECRLAFQISNRNYAIAFRLPDMESCAATPTGRARSQRETVQRHEQMVRSYWRTILLIVKANAEAVALGVLTVEEAFGSMMLSHGGRTLGQMVLRLSRNGEIPDELPLVALPLGKEVPHDQS